MNKGEEEKMEFVNQISVETRNRKSEAYTEKGAVERWINELAESSGKSRAEVAELALVKLELEKAPRR
jgi:hypothetical protein